MDGAVAVIQLNRPERKNPLTFESYAELRDTFRALVHAEDVHAVVFLPNGGNFCSGGDVHEIIGPLVAMDAEQLLAFTRMTGDLVKAMLHCGKPIIAAVDGVAAGAGAIIAMASDMRIATPAAQDRISVQSRRPCRLRHGRLRDPAAHHRPGPRRRTALHRPRHDGAGRRAVGLLQQAGCRRCAGAGSAGAGAPHRVGPDLRQRHHQDAARCRMVDESGSGHRSRSAGAGDLHADQGFRARLRAFVAKQKPVFEGN